jgi:F-type H+-transporting ATPase subunit epsilon
MATFHFDLVSPARLVFAGEVTQVDVPGVDGDFGVLAGHAPLVATLKPGIMTIFAPGGTQRFVVFGGFAEVSSAGMTVLAEVSVPLAEADRTEIAARIRELEESRAKLSPPPDARHDRASEKIEHFRALERMLPHGAVTAEGVDASARH